MSVDAPKKNVQSKIKTTALPKYSTSDETQVKTQTTYKDLLNVGHAQYSITMQIPIATFILVLSVAFIVSFLFYFETSRLLTEQKINEVVIESNLVEPIIEQFYSQANSDILFLSKTPPIQGMLKSLKTSDAHSYQLWKGRIEQIFSEIITNKPFYHQIRYIGIANNGQELINVRNEKNNIIMPTSRLQEKYDRPYFQAAINKDPGQVYFSKIELAKNYGTVEELTLIHI